LWFSMILGLITIAFPTIAARVSWAWEKLAYILSKIIPPVVIGLVYIFVLVPSALLRRVFSQPNLMLDSKRKSYFDIVERPITKKYFEKTW